MLFLHKVRDMCQMFRTQAEKSTDLHNEMRQQLKDIQEQTESTNESHKKLQIRVGDIEQRLSVMQEQIDNISEEQIKLKEAVDAVKDENKAHNPSIEGKLFWLKLQNFSIYIRV